MKTGNTVSYSLRKASENDLETILGLFKNSVYLSNKDFYPPHNLKLFIDEKAKKKLWKPKVHSTYAVVAEKERQLVGYAGMSFWGMLDVLMVENQCQRDGLGSKLLVVLEKYAQQKHLSTLTAQVGLGARPFFENKGFNIVSLNYLEPKGALVPYYLMSKTLL